MTIGGFLQNTLAASGVYVAPLVGVAGLLLALHVLSDIRSRARGSAELEAVTAEVSAVSRATLRSSHGLALLLIAAIASGAFLLSTTILVGALVAGACTAVFLSRFAASAARLAAARGAQAALNDGDGGAFPAFFGGASIGPLSALGISALLAGCFFCMFGANAAAEAAPLFFAGVVIVMSLVCLAGAAFRAAARELPQFSGELNNAENPLRRIRAGVGVVRGAAGNGLIFFSSLIGSLTSVLISGAKLREAEVALLTSFVGDPLTFERYTWSLMGVPLVLIAIGIFALLVGINVVQRVAASRATPVPAGRAVRRGAVVTTCVFLLFSGIFVMLSNVRFCVFAAILPGALLPLVIDLVGDIAVLRRGAYRVALCGHRGAASTISSGLFAGCEGAFLGTLVAAAALAASHAACGAFGVALGALAAGVTGASYLAVDLWAAIAATSVVLASSANLDPSAEVALQRHAEESAAASRRSAFVSSVLGAVTTIVIFSNFENAAGPLHLPLLLGGGVIPILGVVLFGWTCERCRHEVLPKVENLLGRDTRLTVENAPFARSGARASATSATVGVILVVALTTGVFHGFSSVSFASIAAGAAVVGLPLALILVNSGGAWGNARKLIESGALGDRENNPEHSEAGPEERWQLDTFSLDEGAADALMEGAGPAVMIVVKLLAAVALFFASAMA